MTTTCPRFTVIKESDDVKKKSFSTFRRTILHPYCYSIIYLNLLEKVFNAIIAKHRKYHFKQFKIKPQQA